MVERLVHEVIRRGRRDDAVIMLNYLGMPWAYLPYTSKYIQTIVYYLYVSIILFLISKLLIIFRLTLFGVLTVRQI